MATAARTGPAKQETRNFLEVSHVGAVAHLQLLSEVSLEAEEPGLEPVALWHAGVIGSGLIQWHHAIPEAMGSGHSTQGRGCAHMQDGAGGQRGMGAAPCQTFCDLSLSRTFSLRSLLLLGTP